MTDLITIEVTLETILIIKTKDIKIDKISISHTIISSIMDTKMNPGNNKTLETTMEITIDTIKITSEITSMSLKLKIYLLLPKFLSNLTLTLRFHQAMHQHILILNLY